MDVQLETGQPKTCHGTCGWAARGWRCGWRVAARTDAVRPSSFDAVNTGVGLFGLAPLSKAALAASTSSSSAALINQPSRRSSSASSRVCDAITRFSHCKEIPGFPDVWGPLVSAFRRSSAASAIWAMMRARDALVSPSVSPQAGGASGGDDMMCTSIINPGLPQTVQPRVQIAQR